MPEPAKIWVVRPGENILWIKHCACVYPLGGKKSINETISQYVSYLWISITYSPFLSYHHVVKTVPEFQFQFCLLATTWPWTNCGWKLDTECTEFNKIQAGKTETKTNGSFVLFCLFYCALHTLEAISSSLLQWNSGRLQTLSIMLR